MKNYQGKEDSWLEAVGEVEGKRFEVHRVTYNREFRYAWRVIENGQITLKSGVPFETVEQAIDAVMRELVPDAVPVEFEPPTEQDFEALNALLYCGGQNEPITSMEVAVAEHMMFQQVNARVDEVRERAQADFTRAIDIVASTHGPFHQATVNLKKLAQLFDEQMIVISGITDRNIETLRSFILNFLKE